VSPTRDIKWRITDNIKNLLITYCCYEAYLMSYDETIGLTQEDFIFDAAHQEIVANL